MKKSSVIRNIFGGLFIFIGFVGMFSSGLIAGIFMMLLVLVYYLFFMKRQNLILNIYRSYYQ